MRAGNAGFRNVNWGAGDETETEQRMRPPLIKGVQYKCEQYCCINYWRKTRQSRFMRSSCQTGLQDFLGTPRKRPGGQDGVRLLECSGCGDSGENNARWPHVKHLVIITQLLA